jgi:hypothetical protein
MESLVKRGFLHMRTTAMEWLMPESEDVPASLDCYVISFVPFHEQGLTSPSHHFF